ncbi:acyl-CoA dehydrogenase family protein [Rhodococcoides kyotonense]|uniref:acyl-CoA dehydrogenase family protein n=1 Tax=Rhodococcoides kyotonense TaxID=398843 RepID=UPI001FE5D245|nr:acyl-CoA dehydrogenase family protein [Rhodococcus kyotonensis]
MTSVRDRHETSWPERARDIADTVLFPAADAVDAAGEIPPGHFEALAAEGFYGLAARDDGPDMSELSEIVETLCGACLSTAFTWMQHAGVVMSLANTTNDGLKNKYFDGLVDGSIRAGVAFAGAIPRPPKLYARRDDTGYVLDGSAPFVTGWGIIDVVQLSARDEFDDSIVHAVVPARAASGLTVEPLSLIAANASSTVRLRFEGVVVDDASVASVVSDAQFQAGQLYGSWINGCMAMGIARRCIQQMEELGVDVDDYRSLHADARARFDDALAGRYDMFRARAEASELAVRTAAALVAATGSSALVGHGTAERLMREATFTLVAASRPEMKSALLEGLSGEQRR